MEVSACTSLHKCLVERLFCQNKKESDSGRDRKTCTQVDDTGIQTSRWTQPKAPERTRLKITRHQKGNRSTECSQTHTDKAYLKPCTILTYHTQMGEMPVWCSLCIVRYSTLDPRRPRDNLWGRHLTTNGLMKFPWIYKCQTNFTTLWDLGQQTLHNRWRLHKQGTFTSHLATMVIG